MSVPRDAVGVGVLGGRLFACGGYDGKKLKLWTYKETSLSIFIFFCFSPAFVEGFQYCYR